MEKSLPNSLRRLHRVPLAAAVGFAVLVACGWPVRVDSTEKPGTTAPVHASTAVDEEPILPIPMIAALDTRKVALGKKLFSEPRLSSDDTVACVTCHNMALGGTDQQARSIGVGGAVGDINAPTVFNARFNFVQYWNGRARTLEDQIDGPIDNPKEFNSSWTKIIDKLKRDPEYVTAFRQIYEDEIREAHIKDAIATFERSLITPNSRFDRYLKGDVGVITEEEKAGYELFKVYRCVACHQGVNIGGNMFAKIGIFGDYFADRGDVTDADLGRYTVTERNRDRHVFKVPSLRNVALTAPYFHDGSAETLEQAVVVMARYQLGRRISNIDLARIVAFLHTLTGELHGEPLWE